MNNVIVATAILKTMPSKYAQLGIFFNKRRSFKKIAFSTLISCWDLLRFILLFTSSKWTKFDNILIAPQGVLQVKENVASVKKYDDLLHWSSTLVVIRSTRGVSIQRAKNLYDLTCVYVLVAASNFLISHLLFKKRTMSAHLIFCLTQIFTLLVNGKNTVYISDWNNPFSISCILAAKKQNIDSFELQHGVIHENHPAYNFLSGRVQQISCDYLYYWLLPRDSQFITNLYPPENQIYHKPKRDESLSCKIDKTIDILFSLQDSNSSAFIEAILPLIETAENAHIVIKPRRELSKEVRQKIRSQAPHVEINSKSDFDSLLRSSHIHVSHSSTTLLDGAFEKNLTNICFDFDGTALHRNPVIGDLLNNNQVEIIHNRADWLTLWSNRRKINTHR